MEGREEGREGGMGRDPQSEGSNKKVHTLF